MPCARHSKRSGLSVLCSVSSHSARRSCSFFSTSTFAFSADGKILLEQGHFRQLYGVAQERLNRNSNDAEALSWMSAIYDAYGDFDRAVDFARRATEAAPNSSEIHCQFADVLGDQALKLGILGGGIPLARQMRHELDLSLQLDPRNVRCLKESMGLYEQAPAIIGGSKTKARETLQQIYQINPADGALSEAMLLQMQKRPPAGDRGLPAPCRAAQSAPLSRRHRSHVHPCQRRLPPLRRGRALRPHGHRRRSRPRR